MKKILSVASVLILMLSVGCISQEKPAGEEKDVDKCVTSGSASMSLAEAKQIAEKSECAKQGKLKDTSFCNENTGTWWIDLDVERAGCNPACVVNVEEKTAEINWRCTGLLPAKHVCTMEEKEAEACTLEYAPVCGDNGKTYGNGCGACASKEIDFWMQGACQTGELSPEIIESAKCVAETGEEMSLTEALAMVDASECAQEGVVTMEYSCNKGTGTWWIDIEPLTEKEGCNPACVVDVKSKKAELNWRCTGLLT